MDNPDEGRGYAVPPDNPYIDDPSALPEIYASGIRMPWRCSADLGDPETGDGAGRVFCPDVGSKIAEEVNIVEKGGDYGYPTFEGYVCRADNQTCDEGKHNTLATRYTIQLLLHEMQLEMYWCDRLCPNLIGVVH